MNPVVQESDQENNLMVSVAVNLGIIKEDGEIIPLADPNFLLNVANTHPEKQSRVFARMFLKRHNELDELKNQVKEEEGSW